MTSPLGNQICEVLLNLQGYCGTKSNRRRVSRHQGSAYTH